MFVRFPAWRDVFGARATGRSRRSGCDARVKTDAASAEALAVQPEGYVGHQIYVDLHFLRFIIHWRFTSPYRNITEIFIRHCKLNKNL